MIRKNITTEKILLEFDPEESNLLPALEKINEAFQFISKKDAEKVADYFTLSLAKVYQTASFYDLLSTERQPDLVIKVCSGTNCAIRNAFRVVEMAEKYLGVREGDLFNRKVKLEIVSCLGQCGEGPIMVVNDKIFTAVTPSSVEGILKSYL